MDKVFFNRVLFNQLVKPENVPEIAEKLKVSEQTVKEWGSDRDPAPSYMSRLAEVLGVNITAIFTTDDYFFYKGLWYTHDFECIKDEDHPGYKDLIKYFDEYRAKVISEFKKKTRQEILQERGD